MSEKFKPQVQTQQGKILHQDEFTVGGTNYQINFTSASSEKQDTIQRRKTDHFTPVSKETEEYYSQQNDRERERNENIRTGMFQLNKDLVGNYFITEDGKSKFIPRHAIKLLSEHDVLTLTYPFIHVNQYPIDFISKSLAQMAENYKTQDIKDTNFGEVVIKGTIEDLKQNITSKNKMVRGDFLQVQLKNNTIEWKIVQNVR